MKPSARRADGFLMQKRSGEPAFQFSGQAGTGGPILACYGHVFSSTFL
jgi:hypothetical protein